MIGLELAIEQRKASRAQPCNEPGQRNLGSIARAAHHAFAEERAAERQAVQAADQIIAVPAFDRMRKAHVMQPAEHLGDRAVDPGFGAVGRGLAAQGQHVAKCLIGGHAIAILRQHFAQRVRQPEPVERQHRAPFWFDPINRLGVAVIGHRKNAHGISAEDDFRVEPLHLRHGELPSRHGTMLSLCAPAVFRSPATIARTIARRATWPRTLQLARAARPFAR